MSGTKFKKAGRLTLHTMTGLTKTGLTKTGLTKTGLIVAGIALVGTSCTTPEPQEVVAGALEQHAGSSGTFTMTMASESDSEGSPYTFVGGWDGDMSWSTIENEAMFDDMEEDLAEMDMEGLESELGFDETLMPSTLHQVMRGDELLFGEEFADGRARWMRVSGDPLTDDEVGLFGHGGGLNPTEVMNSLKESLGDGGASLDGEGSYSVDVPSEGFVPSYFIDDPAQYQGYSDNPDQVEEAVAALIEWLDKHGKVPVQLGINSEGFLESLSVHMEDSTLADFPECEPLDTIDLSEEIEIEWTAGDGTPPFEIPSDEEILTEDEYYEEAFGEMDDEFADDEWVDGDYTDDVTFTTVAGERFRNEVLRYLIDWALADEIDWTEIPPFSDQMMVDTFNAFFTRHAEEEGGAVETDDGLWLPSHARSALVDQGGWTTEDADALDRAALVEEFNALLAESGGRGTLGPGTNFVPNLYSFDDPGADSVPGSAELDDIDLNSLLPNDNAPWIPEGTNVEDLTDEEEEELFLAWVAEQEALDPGGENVDIDDEEWLMSLEGCPT